MTAITQIDQLITSLQGLRSSLQQDTPANGAEFEAAFAAVMSETEAVVQQAPASTTSVAMSRVIGASEQTRRFGYEAGHDIVGQYQAMTMAHTGSFEDIPATGSYVIADMMKGDKLLSQRIYDPNGRFIASVNPHATGTNNIGQRNAVEELIEIQQTRHGTWAQTQHAAVADFEERRAFLSNTTTGQKDPAFVNRNLRNAAAAVISSKSQVPPETVSATMQAVPPRSEMRDMQAIIATSDPLSALKAATVELYTSGQYQPDSDSPIDLSTIPTLDTSNGYKIAYMADGEGTTEGLAGRLYLSDANGYLVASLGDVTDTIRSGLDAYGVGSVSGDVSQFLVDNPVLNPAVYSTAAESNQELARALSGWSGFVNPFGAQSFVSDRFINAA